MPNPPQRDTVLGHAASASAESYRERRQGTLTRASDGFRMTTLPREPRRPVQQGYKPDPANAPYAYNPASQPGAPFPDKPSTHAFLRAADLGAPRVGFPDAMRTQGHLQQSGAAWGRTGEQPRAVLTPARDGHNAPPTHQMGRGVENELIPRSAGPRWRRPTSPTIYDHLPH